MLRIFSAEARRRIERLNKEVKRRADVVGIFPNEASIIRLIGAVLLEQNDEWQIQHRFMQVEAMAEISVPPIDADQTVPILAACSVPASNPAPIYTTLTDATLLIQKHRRPDRYRPGGSPDPAGPSCHDLDHICPGHNHAHNRKSLPAVSMPQTGYTQDVIFDTVRLASCPGPDPS